MTDRFRLTIGQLNATVGDLRGNAAKARDAHASARAAGADMLALPEMFLSGYQTQDLVLKPAFLRDCRAAIEALAADCADGPAVGIGAPWAEGGKLYNAYLILSGGRIVAKVFKHELAHKELFDELRGRGFDVHPADLGENITTLGVYLLALPRGTRLRFGQSAEVEVTGLRNPCRQINDLIPGLMKEVLRRNSDGTIDRRTGVMGIIIVGGAIRPGDRILVMLPDGPHEPLRPV